MSAYEELKEARDLLDAEGDLELALIGGCIDRAMLHVDALEAKLAAARSLIGRIVDSDGTPWIDVIKECHDALAALGDTQPKIVKPTEDRYVAMVFANDPRPASEEVKPVALDYWHQKDSAYLEQRLGKGAPTTPQQPRQESEIAADEAGK